ncbi:hypothetical protein AB0383_14410 [Amycolatopsis sp. NPDC051373]|uniref:hypothetical protein n=1 Tax=Amycolatopsis sp. NPDC051373 TaxID=3155801 RepID=UPI00344E608E
MYEQPDLPAELSADDVHRQQIANGRAEPLELPGITLDAGADSTGIPFGFTETPREGWTRLTWRTLTERLGRRLGEGMTYPAAT